jgi:hypothetical protein
MALIGSPLSKNIGFIKPKNELIFFYENFAFLRGLDFCHRATLKTPQGAGIKRRPLH